MPSLVEELQGDSLNQKITVAELLRKAYVVATKLDLADFRRWCDSEMNGYKTEVPNYRMIPGTLRAWNPYNGWIPVMLPSSPDLERRLSIYRAGEAISQIQHLVDSPNNTGSFTVTMPSDVQNYLMSGSGVPLETKLHLSRSAVFAILEAVRHVILEWSLKLEKEGITGQGMSFNKDEKQIAKHKSTELQSVINNITIHTMTNSTIQQCSAGAEQKRNS